MTPAPSVCRTVCFPISWPDLLTQNHCQKAFGCSRTSKTTNTKTTRLCKHRFCYPSAFCHPVTKRVKTRQIRRIYIPPTKSYFRGTCKSQNIIPTYINHKFNFGIIQIITNAYQVCKCLVELKYTYICTISISDLSTQPKGQGCVLIQSVNLHLGLHFIHFSLISSMTTFRFFLTFDPTPGVYGVCKDSIFAFMVTCAKFPLI